MAILAHALQMVGGWIAPLIIFFVKSDSKFVRFHSLQVLLFHIFVLVFWMFVAVLWVVIVFATVMGSVAHGGGSNPNQMPFPAGMFLLFPFIWLFAMGMFVTELVLAIVYSIKAGHGEWAQYPVVGRWAKKLLKIAPAAA